MQTASRHFVRPLVAVVTLALGIIFVGATNTFLSLFASPAVETGIVANDAPLVVRPADNIEPIVPRKPEVYCYDMNILPIWHELKKDGEFSDRIEYSDQDMDCSLMLEITRVDLNRDGNEEFLVGGKDNLLCSPVGNCGFWVFDIKNGRARKLLGASDYMDISELGDQVQKTRTHGHYDLLLKGHHSMSQTSYTTYKFDGRRYVESRCVYEVPKNVRQGEGAWSLVNCEEYDHRAG